MGDKKIYCYVEETGQDNYGEMFIVSVVVPEQRDELLKYLEHLETTTGKGRVKWGRADLGKRLLYLEETFNQKKYRLKVFFSIYKETKEYKNATILTIAKTMNNIKNYIYL